MFFLTSLACYENETRLFNQTISYTSDGLLRVSGIPQVCSGGGWITVCNDGTNDRELPTAICQQDLGLRCKHIQVFYISFFAFVMLLAHSHTFPFTSLEFLFLLHCFVDGRLLSSEEARTHGPNSRGALYINNIVCSEVIENYNEDCNYNLTDCDGKIYAIECFDHKGEHIEA